MKTLLRLFSALLLLSPCSLVMGQVQRVTADQALTGAVSITGVITPAQITANQNDYAPTGFTTATDIRLSTDASRNITGLVAPTDGKIKLLENIGSFPIVLQNENTGSSAANRFTLATATDYTMPAGTGVLVRYDLTAARWRIIGSQGGTGGGAGTVTHTAGALTANALALGNGSADLTVLGSLGTTTTVLHGNASGAPSWAAVSLTADVSGILPGANGGTNNGFMAFTGPATSLKTFTLPNVSDTIATLTAALTWTGVHGFTPAARTSGVASYFSITAPADTTLTAGTEAPGITFFGANRQHATGALSIQREYIFAAPTYSFVAASTLTTAITVDIADPIVGLNATIPNKYALRTASELVTGNSTIQGSLAVAGTAQATFYGSGIAPSSNINYFASGTVSSLTGNAFSFAATGTLTATANSDSLHGGYFSAGINTVTFTGLNSYGIRVSSGSITGSGSITNAYLVYMGSAPSTASNKYGLYQAGTDQNVFNGPITVASNSASLDASVFKTASGGMTIQGIAGSVYDLVLQRAGGSTNILSVPTGTNDALFGGNITGQKAILSSAGLTSSGVGYGTGAGASASQGTSRSTGVTLNRPTGDITLFTAAGSTTATTFTVTNSTVVITDTVECVVRSASNKYLCFTTNVAAGSFDITFYTTGGTSSDTPIIHFNVIKGVNN